MALIEINWKPDARRLRVFGAAALAVFALLATWIYVTGRIGGFEVGESVALATSVFLWILSAACGLLALMAPAALRPLYVGLSLATAPIGLGVSFLLLAMVFYGVLTPIGLVLRWMGRDPLQRRFAPQARSYWVARRRVDDIRRYFRQF